MKRFLTIFMFSFIVVFGLQQTTQAAEGDIIIYPYDQEACLNEEPECTGTKVGDAHWDLTYNGYIYNLVGGSTRYVTEMTDDNSDGYIDSLEMDVIGWNAFAALTINDTAEEIIMTTTTARTDLTSVVHRVYVYFDENGDLALFEDHYAGSHYIFNDGTVGDPDWRLATEAEAATYDAADPKPADTMLTTIRMALDDVDSDGYVIEPLASLKWIAQGVDVLVDDVEDWSAIIDGDPNLVTIPAGWTVMSLGYNDRSAYAKPLDFIKSLPAAMADAATAPMTIEYDPQPAVFENLTAQDDDPGTEGINIVVDYLGEFEFPTDIGTTWLNMFDGSGLIQNLTENLDYSVEISQGGSVLETLDFVWNSGTSSYDQSAAATAIDTSMFGSGYTATFTVTTPEGDTTVEEADIVIGVMPPGFEGVEDRYTNEGVYIDLMDGITADDGYENDLTSTIMLTAPEGFNTYNPQPGTYQIDLEFTHHIHFDGDQSTITIDGTTSDWDYNQYNTVTALNPQTLSQYAIFTDATMVHDVTWGYGTVLVLVGADGLVDAIYDRYSWDVDDETGAWNDGGASFTTWKESLVIETGGFVIGSYGGTLSGPLRALTYDSPISFVNRTLSTITINGVRTEWNKAGFNTATSLNPDASATYAIFTEASMVHDVLWGYGTVLVLVGADGLVDAVYDRYSWDVDDETGAWNDGGASFTTWKESLVIEEGGFVVGSHGGTISPALRALVYDDSMAYMLASIDFDYDIITNDSFMLTVDDITAPQILAVNDEYTITVGDFDNVNDAILSNVAAFDTYNSIDELAVYVSVNGGLLLDTPNTYTVEVTVEDQAGNSAVVGFDVIVQAAPVIMTEAEIQALIETNERAEAEIQTLIDAAVRTDAEIQALVDAAVRTDAEIQALIDTTIEAQDTGCGAAITTGSSLLAIIALGGAFIIVIKRRQ